ncbi:hypothetical protein DBR42_02365 [Pelomonas sp. HMWF004]|nr:hypothetical protein DBR42_02365 [Pelomonas sp. HMWF004]
MKALQLSTRHRRGSFEGEATLLVFDVINIDGSTIGDDVRDVLERRPYTHFIFILAPFLKEEVVEAALREGTALRRAGAIGSHSAAEIAVVGLRPFEKGYQAQCKRFRLNGETVVEDGWEALLLTLRDGWLFNLFDRNGGLVNAPIGVHFSKASGKHASKFLRTSCVLLSSEACGVLAFFSLAAMPAIEPRRVFVDTAPLLSLAFALQRAADVRALWSHVPAAKSFSSYGGINDSLRFGRTDLILISASTSGGLAARLVDLGASVQMMLTLYVLKSSRSMETKGAVLCDLTHAPERSFGYPLIDNKPSESCELCKQGYVLAELEGDQFLLEKRAVKRLRVGALSQSRDARQTAEVLTRRRAISVRLLKEDTRRTDIDIDVLTAMSEVEDWEQRFLRQLMRFVPVPLKWIVTVGLSAEQVEAMFTKAGAVQVFAGATVLDASEVGGLVPDRGANALVVAPFLCDHATLRGVNAQLRPKVDGGCVAYLAGLTIADSARNLSDLRIFLQYGEQGADTSTFKSAMDFMLPWTGSRESPWAIELQLLRRLESEQRLPEDLKFRMNYLGSTANAVDGLFWPGQNGELVINPDFVLLDTKEDGITASQADIYAVVCNCLAAARHNNVSLDAKVSRDEPTPVWRQTVFGQSLLCPSNFRDFNDAVLRAALLRAADIQELNYTVDEVSSEEMLDVIRADVASWGVTKGDSLPEFLLAVACRRLRLVQNHLEQLRAALAQANLEPRLRALADEIPTGP